MESMNQHSGHSAQNPYVKLALMIALMFVTMFALMYAMVDRFDHVYANVNQFYMTGLMTAAMVLIELGLMWKMYPTKGVNIAILGVAVVAFIGCWFGIRAQSAVTDTQFVKSMIPHHAGAILMCEANTLADPELRQLCEEIVSSQRREIATMKRKLDQLSTKL